MSNAPKDYFTYPRIMHGLMLIFAYVICRVLKTLGSSNPGSYGRFGKVRFRLLGHLSFLRLIVILRFNIKLQRVVKLTFRMFHIDQLHQ